MKVSSNVIRDRIATVGAVFWAHTFALTNSDVEAIELLGELPHPAPLNGGDVIAYLGSARWHDEGHPVIQMSDDLAVDLMSTHVEDALIDELRAPFRAFIIELPPRVLPHVHGADIVSVLVTTFDQGDGRVGWMWTGIPNDDSVARLYRKGPDWRHLIDHSHDDDDLGRIVEAEEAACWRRIGRLIDSLVLNVALAATEPGNHGPGGTLARRRSQPEKRKPWESPKHQYATYVLGTPVHVNIRSAADKKALRDAFRKFVLTGRATTTRGGITVQFKRMGHWRQQAYGPGWSLHRRIWIAPCWVGPKDAPVLIRPHVLVRR